MPISNLWNIGVRNAQKSRAGAGVRRIDDAGFLEEAMSQVFDPGKKVAQQLQESLEHLRAAVARVDVWAGAMNGLVRPVPDYQPDARYVLPPKDASRDVSRDAPWEAKRESKDDATPESPPPPPATEA